MMSTPQRLKGFRDILPSEASTRAYVKSVMEKVFQKFGFVGIETPTMEYSSLLLGKYGEAVDRLVYTFIDKGGRKVGLRYDQTVPSARFITEHESSLPKYFRRYQIQNVFRAEKPQKGRYREFVQCDIDIFGTTHPISDAEIIACTYEVFSALGFGDIRLRVNDRTILIQSLSVYATENVSVESIIQSIDKMDKIGAKGVINELVKKGFAETHAQKAIDTIQKAHMSNNLERILEYAHDLGVPETSIVFDPTIARGLDYYTGMIFEIKLENYSAGSLGGGGRYDNLIAQLGGRDIPAVGVGLGFDRIVEAARDQGLIIEKNCTDVLVAFFENTISDALNLAQKLRKNKIKTEIYPNNDSIKKQLKYADKTGIFIVCIIGDQESGKNCVTVKNMKTGKQEIISASGVVEFIQKILH